jgi:hypothetical protein
MSICSRCASITALAARAQSLRDTEQHHSAIEKAGREAGLFSEINADRRDSPDRRDS